MKEIVQTLPNNCVLENNLPDNPIIGVTHERYKGWFQRMGFGVNNYHIFCTENGVSNGNGWECGTGTLYGLIKHVRGWEHKGAKLKANLFLFDSERELFEWLAKPVENS